MCWREANSTHQSRNDACGSGLPQSIEFLPWLLSLAQGQHMTLFKPMRLERIIIFEDFRKKSFLLFSERASWSESWGAGDHLYHPVEKATWKWSQHRRKQSQEIERDRVRILLCELTGPAVSEPLPRLCSTPAPYIQSVHKFHQHRLRDTSVTQPLLVRLPRAPAQTPAIAFMLSPLLSLMHSPPQRRLREPLKP